MTHRTHVLLRDEPWTEALETMMAQVRFPALIVVDDGIEIMDPDTFAYESSDRVFHDCQVTYMTCGLDLIRNTWAWWHEGEEYPEH